MNRRARCELEARAIERERNPTAQQILDELDPAERARMLKSLQTSIGALAKKKAMPSVPGYAPARGEMEEVG